MDTENIPIPTILVVDDDQELLNLMEFKLQIEGFHPIVSLNGQHIREIITQSPPDLILLDIQMKGVDGGDICKQIKADPDTANIPILMFSANENIRMITKECGADGFITKPFQTDNFRNTIRQYLPGMPGK
jgi:DNA-binding response OmpR family regulator